MADGKKEGQGDIYNFQYARDHEKEDPADYWEFKEILKLHKPLPQAEVLEIGCNTGEFCWLLEQKYEVIIRGVDINQEAISRAKSKYPDMNFQLIDLFEVEGSYDVIYMQHVIEHLKNPKKALKHIKNLLKDKGVFILSCPNQWAYILKLNCWIHGTRFCYDSTHLNEFNPQNLTNLLHKTGFKHIKYSTRPLGLPLLPCISKKLYFSFSSGKFGGFIFMIAQK